MWKKRVEPKFRGFRALQALVFFAFVVAALSLAPQVALATDHTGSINAGPVTIAEDGSGVWEITIGGASAVPIVAGDTVTITGTTTNNANFISVDGTHSASASVFPFNIILQGASSNLTGATNAAFIVTEGATVNLTLEGDNVLSSGGALAGLFVDEDSSVIINSVDSADSTSGSLSATGGSAGGAGIGGSAAAEAGYIFINSGTIRAYGGLGAAGIGGGRDHYFMGVEINDFAFIENAVGGNADLVGGTYGAGAGIGTGGSNSDLLLPVTSPAITIRSGVDLGRIFAGAGNPSAATAGARIGSGGALDGTASASYALHTITYHTNEDTDLTKALTYTTANGVSDAVLATLDHLQLHDASFVPAATSSGFWYETYAGAGPHAIATAFSSASIYDLYWYNEWMEPKTGL